MIEWYRLLDIRSWFACGVGRGGKSNGCFYSETALTCLSTLGRRNRNEYVSTYTWKNKIKMKIKASEAKTVSITCSPDSDASH